MPDHSLGTETVKLAGDAADLSVTLCSLLEKCGHETTSTDISSIAAELALLSQALQRLHEAMALDPYQYTDSFDQDLSEITMELHMIFEEITECCDELRWADREDAGKVAWLFKKGRVHKLQKHLEVLKQTVQVMRMVIWHGKDYGTHNSPGRLAESSPHTMHEDRVILETVFASNRNAIIDLHMLESPGHDNGVSEVLVNAGPPRRKLSTSASVEHSPSPDVPLPATVRERPSPNKSPARRFSKRGVRLAVHSSILDTDAHNARTELKHKWLQESRDQKHQRMASLSKISEVESSQSCNKLDQAVEEAHVSGHILQDITNNDNARKPPLERNLPSTVVEYPLDEDARRKIEETFPKRRPSLKMVTTPLRKMMHKLSVSRERMDDANKDNSRLSVGSFQNPALKTPDYDKEFENGV